MFMGERWVEEATDDLHIAADYLFSVLVMLAVEMGELGHMAPQPVSLIAELFFGQSFLLYAGVDIDELMDDLDPAMLYMAIEEGYTYEEIEALVERTIQAVLRFAELHVDAFSAPSALWFYGIDPYEFDFDVELAEQLGFMNPDNVTTAIIEEGRIAYFHIASFLNNLELDAETLFPFFEEIQDFEHLIIDLRGNMGGFVHWFPTNVAARLIDEPLSFEFTEFFIASELTAGFFENPHAVSGGISLGIYPIAERVEYLGLTEFNPYDLALLDYAIVWQSAAVPAEDNTPFGGEIWLLVDGSTGSTSEMAAKFSTLTGFATVVGEPTAGVTQVTHAFVPLPNTGILFRIDLGYTIDQYGRSIEEFGVIPHIFNAEGLDALETLLSIIAPELFAELMAARAEAEMIDEPEE